MSISNLFGKTFKDKVNVYCDIKSAAEQVSALISLLGEKTEQASALSVQSAETETVQAIIQKVLEINFSEMVSVLQVNANGFTTTVDLGEILNLAGLNCELGNVTLGYDMTSHKLTGKALGEGVVINAYAGKEFSAPEGEFLDVSELLGSVTEILSGNVGVNVMLNGGTMEEFLKANNLVDLNGLLAGATLTISGSVDITSLRASVEISLYKERDGGTYYYAHADAYYQYAEGGYGTAYIRLDKLLGADCDIKVMSDISETISSVQKLIESINGGAAVQTLSGAVSESDADSLAAVISGVLGMRLDLIILDMQSSIDGFTVNLNADKLISEILKLTDSNATVPVTIGNIALSYSIADDTLSGSALGGGLTVNVTKGVAVGNAPSGYTDINKVIDLITKAADIANGIRNNEYISFSADAAITLNGTSFALDGKGEVSWAGGVVKNVALDFTLSLSASGAEDKAPAAIKVIYNADAADDKPFIRIAINNYLIDITRNDISETESQIKAIADSVNTLLGKGTTDGGALASLAEAAGMTTAAGAGSSSSVTVVNAELIKAVIGVLNGEGLAGELFTSLLSGSAVTVDELTNSIKVAFGENNDITLGVNNNSLTFDGIIKLENLADIDVSATASYAAINLASDLLKQFESEQYEKYSTAEGDSLIKAVYNYILDCIDTIDVSSFLNGDNYKVSLVLAGNVSGIESLSGVEVQADLFFSDGLVNGEKVSDKLVQIRLKNIKVDGFTMSATASYMGRNLYIAIDQINGTTLSGLNVYVSADDLSRAVKNIVELVTNEKVVNFFSGIIGNGEQVSDGVATLSEEGQQSFEDLLVMLLSLDYCKYIDIMPDTNGKVTIAADIGGLLDVFGIQQSAVGKATINTDGNGGLDIDVYRKVAEGEAEPSYGWLRLDALRTEESNIGDETDYSKYINIGFVADLIKDAGKFITSNTDSNGEISSLFTFEGGRVDIALDLTKVDMTGSGFADDIISGIVSGMGNIVIDEINMTVGIDDRGELYFSFEGTLNQLKVLSQTIVKEHKIGVTYSDGYITFARGEGTSREYWVMTPEYLIDNLFTEQSDTADSPLRWLCDIQTFWFFGNINVWNIIVSNLGDITSGLSSGAIAPDEVYLYKLFGNAVAVYSENTNVTPMPSLIADYIIGFVSNVGTTCEVGYYESALSNLGLENTALKYYAAAINGDVIASDMFDALDVALIHSDDTGLGGIKAYASIQDSLATITFNINYNKLTEKTVKAENNYESALKFAGTNEDGTSKIDFAHSEALYTDSGEIHYADEVFGGAQVSQNGTVNNAYLTKYVDGAITVTVYQSEEDYINKTGGKQIGVRYNSTIYMHSASDIMAGQNGKINIYVMVGADGQPYLTEGEYPESVQVTALNTDFYIMEVDYKAVRVTVHNILDNSSVTLDVYSGATLDEIAAAAYGEYTLISKWYLDASKNSEYAFATVAVPEEHDSELYTIELYAEFIRTEVVKNGVKYTFVADGGYHYEVSGYTASIGVYYSKDYVLVLENEIDGYPVTKIQAGAFANTSKAESNSLKNVIVPETIKWVGGRAFLDNKGILSLIFLAEDIEFSNDMTVNPNGIAADSNANKNYPFYGCTKNVNDNSSLLNIYYDSDVDVNNTKTFCVKLNSDRDWTRIGDSGYGGLHTADKWAYISVDINDCISGYNTTSMLSNIFSYLKDSGYAYDENIYNATGCLFVSGTSFIADTSADFTTRLSQEIVRLLNLYTSGENGEGPVGMYNALVTVKSLSNNDVDYVSGALKLTVDIISTEEAWYHVNAYCTIKGESSAINPLSIVCDNQLLLNGKLYIKAGSVVTVTSQDISYIVNSVSVNYNADISENEDGSFSFVMQDSITELKVDYRPNGTEINIVSEVAFRYKGVEYAGSGTIIETSDTISENIAAVADNYYFLGWAVSDGSSLEFASDLTVGSNDTYYAIWAVSSRNIEVKIADSSLTSDNTSVTTTSEGTFYKWYTDENFTTEFEALAEDCTVVYARWQFELKFSLDSKTSNTSFIKLNGDKITVDNTTCKIDIYEGNYVEISYSYAEAGLISKVYYSVLNIDIYEFEGGTKVNSGSFKTNKTNMGSGDRRFKYARSYNGVWEQSDIQTVGSGNECRIIAGKEYVRNVTNPIGIIYSA